MSKYRGPDPEPEFVRVGRVVDLPPGAMVRVEVDGHDVALMNLDGEFYALDDQCAHNGGPLSQGRFDSEKGRVSCPWHAWTWDVRTGKALLPPVNYQAPCYTVRVEGDNLLVSRYPR